MKKLLAMLVVALGVSSLFAQTYYDKGTGITWSLEKNGSFLPEGGNERIDKWLVTGVKPVPASLTVPAKLGDTRIYGIKASAFAGNDVLSNLVVEAGIREIATSAFAGCANLVSVTIGAGVDVIGNGAFEGDARLATVAIGGDLGSIASDALEGTKFLADAEAKGESVIFGAHLYRYFGKGASYAVPAGVRFIDDYAFAGVSTNDTGAIALTNVVFNEGLESIGVGAFATGCDTNFVFDTVSLPDSVIEIGNGAFGCCEIKNFKIGAGITDISAFRDWFTAVKALPVFPNGGNSFETATPLTETPGEANGSFYLGVSSAANNVIWQWVAPESGSVEFRTAASAGYVDTTLALYDSARRQLAFNDDGADNNCSRLSYWVTEGETYFIGVGRYSGANEFKLSWKYGSGSRAVRMPTESIDFGDGVEEIPEEMFYGSTLESVKFGAGLRKIGASAFEESAVSSVDFSAAAQLREIGWCAFFRTRIRSLDLTGCTALRYLSTAPVMYDGEFEESEDYTFAYCDQLASVKFPAGLKGIGGWAFCGCYALTDITFNEGLETIGDGAFNFAEDGEYSAISSLKFPSTLKRIGNSAFYGSTNLTSVVLNEGLEWIGYGAFGVEDVECAGLTSVAIPKTVTYVGGTIFEGNTNLTTITGGDGIAACDESCLFGWDVPADPSQTVGVEYDEEGKPLPFKVIRFGKVVLGFQGPCAATLGAEDFGDAVAIAGSAFNDGNRSVTNLTSVSLPRSIESIGSYAFERAINLKSVQFPAGASKLEIGYRAFYQTGITDLSGSFLSIGWSAFADCSDLKTVDITLSSVADGDFARGCYLYGDAFAGCSNLGSAKVSMDYEVEFGDGSEANAGGVVYYGAFAGCAALTNVSLKALTIYDWGESVFAGCENLETAVIDILNIPSNLFEDCNALRTVAINGRAISAEMFADKLVLESIEIGDDVAEIGADAFSGCTNLTAVTGCEGVLRVGRDAFDVDAVMFGDQTNGAFVVNGILVKYVDVEGEVTAVIPEGVRLAAQSAFDGCAMGEIVFPTTAERIWNYTAYNCANLKSVVCKNPDVRFQGNPQYDANNLFGNASVQVVVQKVGTRPVGYVYNYDATCGVSPRCNYIAAFERFRFHNDDTEDGAFVAGTSYTGWITDVNGAVVGSVTVKTGKPDNDGLVKVTAAVELAGLKKSYSALFTVDENGKAVIADANANWYNELKGVCLGGNWLSGQVCLAGVDYTVRGGNAAKNVDQFDSFADRVWAMAFVSYVREENMANAAGFSTLTVTPAKKGKIKVAGTMSDGTKVSATAQMVAGDNGIVAAPVTVQLYAGKRGGFSFLLQFYLDENGNPKMDFDDGDQDGQIGSWRLPYVHEDVRVWGEVSLGAYDYGVVDVKGTGVTEEKTSVDIWDDMGYSTSMLARKCAVSAWNVRDEDGDIDRNPCLDFGGDVLTLDAKNKWTFAKAAKLSLPTEKDLEAHARDLAQAAENGVCQFETADGKWFEAYQYDAKYVYGDYYEGWFYTPKSWWIWDIGSKVDKKNAGLVKKGENTNRYDLRLKYTQKTGAFSGSSLYYWVDQSKPGKPALKKGKFSISGVVIGGQLYGAAVVKDVASFFVGD